MLLKFCGVVFGGGGSRNYRGPRGVRKVRGKLRANTVELDFFFNPTRAVTKFRGSVHTALKGRKSRATALELFSILSGWEKESHLGACQTLYGKYKSEPRKKTD